MDVSVILAVKNRTLQLNRCLKSYTKLTYKNYEMIVVDDSSQDDVQGVVSRYIDQLPIQFFRLDGGEDRTPNKAWLNGFQKSTGKFLIFSNGDLILSGADLIERYLEHYKGVRMSVLTYFLSQQMTNELDTIDWFNHPELIQTFDGFWDGDTNGAKNSIRKAADHTTYMTAIDRERWEWFGNFRDEETHLVADQDIYLREKQLNTYAHTLPDYVVYHQCHPIAKVKTAPSYVYSSDPQARLMEQAGKEQY